MLELDWLALGVAVKYQLPLDNSPQSTLMWKRHQAFSTHRRTLMSKRLIKAPIRYYFDNIMERVKRKNMSISKAKLYLHGIINNLENCIEEGSYVTYQDIINQCKKVLKELEE